MVIGVLLTAAGHGTNLLLRIASAPVSFFGFVPSIVGPPLLWAVMSALLACAGAKPQRQILALVMFLHYFGVLLVPLFGEDGEGKYLERVWTVNPVAVLGGGSLYLAGQIVIWLYWSRAGRDYLQHSSIERSKGRC